jgi:hypothetical protein
VVVAGEFGVLPHAPFDKANSVAPSVSPLLPSSDVHVNAYHTNANLFVRPSPWGRLVPYATAGFGGFTGSTVVSTATAGSHIVQYSRETNPATNLGAGATYRLTNWLAVRRDSALLPGDGEHPAPHPLDFAAAAMRTGRRTSF